MKKWSNSPSVFSRLVGFSAVLFFLVSSFFGEELRADEASHRSEELYQIPLTTIDGQKTTLKAYQNHVLLIVNTASGCGYTPQYSGLEKLYEKYKTQGLVVLGFPSNDFFYQEPGSNSEIKFFCKANYQIEFPLFAKASVKGNEIQPLYQYLLSHAEDHSSIGWNFEKILVGRDGQVLKRFRSGVTPESDEIVKSVEAALRSPTSAPSGLGVPPKNVEKNQKSKAKSKQK
jgi:glutathione peroxidase